MPHPLADGNLNEWAERDRQTNRGIAAFFALCSPPPNAGQGQIKNSEPIISLPQFSYPDNSITNH